MKKLPIALSLFLASCSFTNRSPSTPSRLPNTNNGQNTVCLVRVEIIPDVQGEGYIWLQSTDTTGLCGAGPKFSISNPSQATIFPWPADPTIAYVGGHEGFYTVTASYDNGNGQIAIQIEH
jgi:hypothetical protein